MLFFKKKALILCAPVSGTAIPLDEVEDEAFRSGLLGKGLAIRPSSGRLVAPCDGSVAMVAETGHAVNLLSSDGAELLIHVGIDTVKLAGEGFTALVKAGQRVKTGDVLLTFDPELIERSGFDPVVLMTVCNTEDYKTVEPMPLFHTKLKAGEKAIHCQKE